jgi:hypothetical protein
MRGRLTTRTMTVRTIAASFAAAAAIFGGLAVQMAHGHDPALGAGTSTATGTTQAGSGAGSSEDQAGGSQDQFGGSQDQSGGSATGVVTRAS